MNKIFLLLLFLMVSHIALAQQKFTISGHITDSANNEGLIGATVVDPLSLKGTFANNYGFYSITLPAGKFKLTFSRR
ncbi:MAG: carboxypeptidase-like regulatory domain-containing protein [Mariniphaga sp.]|nr:carboxypeptidase-like regulatory domain-containing protein [Mariniphaga sp.]